MIEIKEKNKCCGCSACYQACPHHCIQMVEDVEGFLYPKVEKDRCINCNLCKKACPILNNVSSDSDRSIKSWIGYAKNTELRLASSSGGVFSVLAEKIIERGGVVFGAAFDENYALHHIMIESPEELALFRGSKYLQSRIDNSFLLAREQLDSGKWVLFSGVSCQIAGLKTFLRKDYSNLVTIDVLCHGVPSPELWKRYYSEKEKEYGGVLQNAIFRDKKNGWKKYSVKLVFSNNTEYTKVFKEDSYMQLFLKNLCLRPSCHKCMFKDINRPSDITLGDAWGVNNYCPEMDDDRGTSIIITHSEEGEHLLHSVQDKLVIQIRELNEILPATADSRKPVTAHINRKKLFKMLAQGKSITNMIKLIHPSMLKRVLNRINRSRNLSFTR
ncbi:Coenzyme F420-reducing hydrogenase, beta subunit [Sarcina sp. DSM 11001]|uniref:Coenzyme F420 hydrogenase/dehydrogenase, beta subunit C-terminal domain n=1 Tax=Sarcina sp. DSM 11001 TaxID=1798184 RepID=UPI000892012A|nr:Coenzyme F420 hydrogenase/dehydrogenase, beta subunit C-terminal domain [Sarcina sp. DSM 11001]SDM05930.1 Coenzyme F420-reducing hydrogenase, beta subunit [Sarcina sp. DSM 11001]